MSMIKAVLLGAILTGVLALIVGSQGSAGGLLYIFSVEVHGHGLLHFTFYWSWPLFLAGSGLAWGILLLLD